jgi:hypothetical protein
MTSSRAAADLLIERAEICRALFAMAADSPERIAAAKRLREIHADTAVARILEKAAPTAPPGDVAAWVPTPDEPGEPETVRWPSPAS